jgi:hypothetical protein
LKQLLLIYQLLFEELRDRFDRAAKISGFNFTTKSFLFFFFAFSCLTLSQSTYYTMNLVAIGTPFSSRFLLSFFPKRAAKIGGTGLRFQIFLSELNGATSKAAMGAGFSRNIF